MTDEIDDELDVDLGDELVEDLDFDEAEEATGNFDLSSLDEESSEQTLPDLNSEDLLEETSEMDMDLEEATGDIDISQLEEDLSEDADDGDVNVEVEEEYLEDEDEDEDEEQSQSPVQKILAKVPALQGIFDKFSKNRSADEEEDEDLEDDGPTKTEVDPSAIEQLKENKTGLDKLTSKLPALQGLMNKLQKKKVENEDEDEDQDEFDPDEVAPISYASDEAAPKRKIKVIHILIALGGIAVFLLPSEDEKKEPEAKLKNKTQKVKTAKDNQEPTPKAPVQKKDPPKEVAQKPKKAAAPIDLNPTTTDRTKEQMKEVGTISKDELGSDLDIPVGKPEKVVKQPPKNEQIKPQQAKVSKDESDELDDLFNDSPVEKVDKKDKAVTSKQEDKSNMQMNDNNSKDVDEIDDLADLKESSDNDIDDLTGQKESNLGLSDGQITDEVVDSTIGTDITKSILDDLEVKIQADKKQQNIQRSLKPIDPPVYEMSGRGLVYNCADKHWACIDSISFKTCEQNYSWNADQGKKIECYPVKLYESIENCAGYQQKNIDTVADTNFCRF